MVSIIIPAYNCEPYLPFTLESVRRQSYSDLEVIIVNDGSNDRTGSICDFYCQKDYRFHVIHQSNKGPGEARNSGLSIAHGDFICFVDGGDYIHSRAIECLYNALADTNADLSLIDVCFTHSLEKDISSSINDIKYVFYSADQLVFNMISNQGGPVILWAVVWNKMYRRDLIKSLKFHSLICNEDADFNLRVYLQIKNAVLIKEKLYFYLQNQDSVVRTPEKKNELLYINTVSNYKMIYHLYGEKKELYLGWMLDYLYRRLLSRRLFLKGTPQFSKFLDLTKLILKKTGFDYYTNSNISFLKKIRFTLYWLFPSLFVWRYKHS